MRLLFGPPMQALSPVCSHPQNDCSDTVICHCLGVTRAAVEEAIALCGLKTVKEISRETGAGSGCTACHAKLRELLREARQPVPVC